MIAMPLPLLREAGFTSQMFCEQCLAGRLSATRLPRAKSLNFDWSKINSFKPTVVVEDRSITNVVGVVSKTL